MPENNFNQFQEAARTSAIEKKKKELEENKEFYKLKKLNELIKNNEI